MSRTNRNRRRAGAIVTLAAAVGIGWAVLPAGAASESVAFTLTSGQLSVGDTSFALPTTSGFNGTLDDQTGALDGSFVFPVIESNLTQPFPVTVKVALSQQGSATGTIDPVSGAADLAATVHIGLEIRTAAGALLVGAPCGIGPVSLTFEGAFDAATGTLTLSDDGFVLPASSGCASPGVDFGPIIDDLLAGETSADLVLSTSSGPVTTPSSTPTTSGTTPSTSASTPTGPTTSTPPTTPGPRPTTPPPGGGGGGGTRQDRVQPRIVDRTADDADVIRDQARVTG
jgi:hypothetical protein